MDPNSTIAYIFKGFLFLLGFGSILFLAYITTRLLATKAQNVMKGKYINVVETISLGVDKKLHLVKIEETYMLISSSGKSIEFLSIVPIESQDEKPALQRNLSEEPLDFKSNLDRLKNIITNSGISKEKDRNIKTYEKGE